jgi:Flp pilus assembly protein TadD
MPRLAPSWRPGVLAILFLCACGGSEPSPKSPAAAAPVASAEPEPPSAPEPAVSPELLTGIKAFDAGHYVEARASFQAAAKKNPRDYEAQYNLGMTCEKLGDEAGAEAAYKAALGVESDLETAAAELCALYVDEGRIDDALAVGRAGLAAHPRSAALHENLGVALAAGGDAEAATRELEEAVRIAPREPMLQLTLAHWLNVWHARGAAPHLDVALSLVKGDYAMTASIGHEYRMAGEFPSCVKTFEAAIAVKDGGEVRTERALCRLGQKDEAGALEDLQLAVKAEPSYAPAHYYLGGRLASGKHFKEAAAEYAESLKLAPAGSLAKPAAERLKAAQEAARRAPPTAPKK